MSRKLVLVADDQEPIRTMLKMSLEFMGYEVAVAENGKVLLTLARERVPDLIITDVMMPEMTGYEALEELRKDEALAKVPVIVLTALEEASYTTLFRHGPPGGSMNRGTTTTPLLNVLDRDGLTLFSEEYKRVCDLYHDEEVRPVPFMKGRLGKQDYCFTGFRRYWVWESGAGWRIYVNNEAGIGFEVDATLAPSAALTAWADFQQKLGLGEESTP